MLQTDRKHRVFVVDDERIISSTLATILCLQGFDATPFTLPIEVLEAARSEAPDLLISDVVMPLLSGVELAIQVQECCPDCKVLLFSGQATTASMLETANANGHHFELLAKPLHPKDLLKKLETTFELAS